MISLSVIGSAPPAVKEEVKRALLAAYVPARFKLHDPQHEEKERHTPLAVGGGGQSQFFQLVLDSCDAPLTNPREVPYDCRFVWTNMSTADEVVREVTSLLDDRRFVSTRGAAGASTTFLSVVRDGLAPDGGLFTLQNIPRMSTSQVHYVCTAPALSYVGGAQIVLERLVDASMLPGKLHELLVDAYEPSRWSGLQDVCPVTSLCCDNNNNNNSNNNSGDSDWENMSVLELYHGPTAAFKDFALQLFPRYFDLAVANKEKGKKDDEDVTSSPSSYVMLTATSGDTGVAAISGFVNARSSTRVLVLYPLHGVSPVQQIQMLSYDNGTSVRVYGVESDFDFCQSSVKQIFANRALAQRLCSEANVRLSSANSINWGRLIPQVVYYFWAYRQLVANKRLRFGDLLDVVVPCGNFGNILAAFFARRIGLPLGMLVVASNCNDVLFEFVQTGRYDIRQRHLTQTASPSIDILKASNVERFLFLLSGGDAAFVAAHMHRLETERQFALEGDALAAMKEVFWSARCSEAECAATIKEIYELSSSSSSCRLLDPHTAVAVFAAREFLRFRRRSGHPRSPLVIASTAHWSKFPGPVLHALRGEAMTDDKRSTVVEGKTDPVHACRDLYDIILAEYPHLAVHPALSDALAAAESRAVTPRVVKADLSCVEEELLTFVSGNSA